MKLTLKVSRSFLFYAIVAYGFFSLACGGGETSSPEPAPTRSDAFEFPERPNIVLVLIDTLRRDHVETYDYDRPTTPFLLRLANEGIVADNAWAQAPQTFLSTATLFSSRRFPLVYELDPAIAKAASDDPHPRVHAVHDANLTLAETLDEAGYDTFAAFTNPHHHPASGFDQGFAESVYVRPTSDVHPYGRGVEVQRRFFQWLDERSSSDSFFAYLHLMEVHNPYRPPRAIRKEFVRQKGRDLYVNGLPEEAPSDVDLEYMRSLYDGEIRFTDGVLEALVDELRNRGLWHDTLLVITSDHGDEFMEHGGLGHGTTVHSELLRIPMLFAGAGLQDHPSAGGRLTGLVRNLDLAPTFVELAGIDVPGSFEGVGLADALRSPSPAAPEEQFTIARHRRWRSLTDGRFHLIYDPSSGERRLFDLESDPDEQRDVAEEHPDVVRRMARELSALEEEQQAAEQLAASLAAGGERLSPEIVEQLRALGYLD